MILNLPYTIVFGIWKSMNFSCPIIAGDDYSWHQDFEAPIPTKAALLFRSAAKKVERLEAVPVPEVDHPGRFEFNLIGAQSGLLEPGNHTITLLTWDDQNRRTTGDCSWQILVKPDPEADPCKTFSEKMLERLRAHLLDRAQNGFQESTSIEGDSLAKAPTDVIQDLISRYERRVNAQRRIERRKAGQRNPKTIYPAL